MKHLILTLLSILGIATGAVRAQEDGGPLPFTVSLGGTAATHKKGEPFAKVAGAVAANAELIVGVQADMIIANVAKAKADGTPVEGGAPAIILLQKTSKTTLDQTMDKQKFAPGNYLLSISAGERTATIQFSIK